MTVLYRSFRCWSTTIFKPQSGHLSSYASVGNSPSRLLLTDAYCPMPVATLVTLQLGHRSGTSSNFI